MCNASSKPQKPSKLHSYKKMMFVVFFYFAPASTHYHQDNMIEDKESVVMDACIQGNTDHSEEASA